MPIHISNAKIRAYANDGVVLIKNLLSTDEVDDLRLGIDKNISNPSYRSNFASDGDDPGWFIEDFCNWQDNPAYQRIILESQISKVASKLMSSEKVRLYHDHILLKKSGTKQRPLWHQDLPYYKIEGRQNVSFWIHVDQVPLEWTPEFVAGSRLVGWYLPQTFLKNEPKWFNKGNLKEPTDTESDPAKYRILSSSLEPKQYRFICSRCMLDLVKRRCVEFFLYVCLKMISGMLHAVGKLLQSFQNSPKNLELVHLCITKFSQFSGLQILHNFFFKKTQ